MILLELVFQQRCSYSSRWRQKVICLCDSEAKGPAEHPVARHHSTRNIAEANSLRRRVVSVTARTILNSPDEDHSQWREFIVQGMSLKPMVWPGAYIRHGDYIGASIKILVPVTFLAQYSSPLGTVFFKGLVFTMTTFSGFSNILCSTVSHR